MKKASHNKSLFKTIKNALFIFTFLIFSYSGFAQKNTPSQKDSVDFNFTRLQWTGLELDAKQYEEMYHMSKEILHLRAVVDQPGFSVFQFPNGSLYELYGPGSPDTPWKNGKDGFAVGFAVDDIKASIKQLKEAGIELLGELKSAGPNYHYQFFKAADGRVYAIAQVD